MSTESNNKLRVSVERSSHPARRVYGMAEQQYAGKIYLIIQWKSQHIVCLLTALQIRHENFHSAFGFVPENCGCFEFSSFWTLKVKLKTWLCFSDSLNQQHAFLTDCSPISFILLWFMFWPNFAHSVHPRPNNNVLYLLSHFVLFSFDWDALQTAAPVA